MATGGSDGVVVLTNGVYSSALVERLEQHPARVAVGGDWTPPNGLPSSEDEPRARHEISGRALPPGREAP